MEIKQFDYEVKANDTYMSIALYIINSFNENEEYKQFLSNEEFIKKVADGIKTFKQGKKLVTGNKLKLVKEIDFYLGITKVETVKQIKREDKVNHISVSDKNLYFTIRLFQNFDSYAWSNFYNDGESKKYGEIDMCNDGMGIKGDKFKYDEINKVYIYIFNESKKLISIYYNENGKYQSLSATEDDKFYENLGNSAEYMTIRNFFNVKLGDMYTSRAHYIVASKIKLKVRRIFGYGSEAFKMNVEKRGIQIGGKDKKWMKELIEKDTRSADQILKDYRNRKSTPSLDTYNLHNKKYDGKDGFILYIPDALNELKRRSENFHEKYESYEDWMSDETHVNEAFIYNAVKGMIDQDKNMEGEINKNNFNSWEKQNSKDYREKYFPVHYSVNNLLTWLKSGLLKETLKDYLYGTDKEKEESDKYYNEATKYLYNTKEGSDYLSKEFNEKYSYINQSIVLYEDYFNDDQNLNAVLTARKWNNVTFEMMKNAAPFIIYKRWHKGLRNLCQVIKKRTGHVINFMSGKPYKNVKSKILVADVKSFLKKTTKIPDSTGGKSLINFMEAVNVCIAVSQLMKTKKMIVCKSCDLLIDEESKNEKCPFCEGSPTQFETIYDGLGDNIVNLVGSVCDFASNNWLTETGIKSLARKMGTSKMMAGKVGTRSVAVLTFVSGVIDCYLGISSGMKSIDSGEIGVAIGWGVFALGGAITAAGAVLTIAATYMTVGSGGTAIMVGGICFIAGAVLEGIGLFLVTHFENRDIKDWLYNSKFGKQTEGNKKNLVEQIQKLNDILCDFRVKGEFKKIEEKFDNRTYVNIIIEPRIITNTSILTFTDMKAIAEARVIEYVTGNDKSTVQGMAGSPNPVIELIKPPRNCTVKKERNIIKEIRVEFNYGMDIDRVSGKIKLEIEGGSLQGLTKSFEVT